MVSKIKMVHLRQALTGLDVALGELVSEWCVTVKAWDITVYYPLRLHYISKRTQD